MKNKLYRIGAIALALSITLSFSAFAGEWMENSIGWWFQNSDGSYPKSGIYEIGGKEYAFNEDGYMAENAWYQHPKTGDWYYATGSGELAHSQWVGDYYVGNDGSMMTDAWIDGYYVGSDGQWVKGMTLDDTYDGASYDEYGDLNTYDGASYDEYGDLHNPFRDAPLGYGYDSSLYSGTLGRSSIETADSRPHDYWLEY